MFFKELFMPVKFSFFLFILLLSISQTLFADRYVLRHLCFKPEKPLFMASFFQHELYKKDVENYESCIKQYISEQKRAIVSHQEAIKEAAGDWKIFEEQNQ